jgi:glycosyltransferase involved in cell wall biosynthesis
MIGPVVKIDPETLPKLPNIHWLGAKSYADLPRYLSGWDVGLMPFALNESTRFISPTKTPEFLAAGVPVVSTPITDVVRPYGEKGLVEIAKTPLEVMHKAEALMRRPKDAWLAKVDRHLAAGSWDKTWATMHRLMLDGIGEAERPAASQPSYAITAAE